MTGQAASLWPSTLRESVIAKAFVAYGSGSWVLLQVVTTFIDGLGLPDWVFTGFLWILIAGVPIVALAAYAAARKSGEAPSRRVTSAAGKLTFNRVAMGGGVMLTLWLLVVAGFMASWAFGVGPAASLLAAGTLKQSDPVLIAEFTNKSHDPVLASTVTEAIRVDLSQSNVIRVVDQDNIGDARERMGVKDGVPLDARLSRELAVREGLAGVLEGEVASLGPATLISARLVNPRTGRTMAEYHERAKTSDELLDAVDRLSSTMRNKIGEPLTKLRVEPPLAKVTTTSMPALRAYTAANAAHAAGKKDDAAALLRSALQQDPNFPMAWRKLGVLLGDDDPLGARLAYTNAYKLRANLPERERELATGSYFKNVEGDLPLAMAAYKRVLVTHPDDETALTNLANLHTAHQQPEEALELQLRVVGTSPRFAAYSNLFNSYVRLGRLDKAAETQATAARLFPDQKRVKFQPIILAVAKNDLAAADRLMEEFLIANRAKPELANDLFVARFELKRGRVERARAIFRERARSAAAKGETADAIGAMTSLVAIARSLGRPDEGRAVLAEALAAYPLSTIEEPLRPYLDLAEAYALTGDAGTARAYLTRSDAQGGPAGTLNYDQRGRTLGLIALAEGRNDEAVAILSRAASFGQCSTCVLFDLGLAQEAAGRPADALATYGKYVRLAPFALGRGEQLGFAMIRLANLHDKAGNAQAASQTRKSLMQLWARGDADLQAGAKGGLPPRSA